MEWQQYWYGHSRSFAHKFVTNGLVFGSLLGAYGLCIDFVSSAFWWRWGSYLSAFLAILTFGFICRAFTIGQLQTQPGASVFLKAVGFVVLPFLIFTIWWLLIVRVIPDSIGRVLGTPAQITSPMRAVFSDRRRRCDYRLEGEVLGLAYPHYLCTSSGFASFPSDVFVTLHGKETALGMHIHSFALSEGANKALQATRETRAPES